MYCKVLKCIEKYCKVLKAIEKYWKVLKSLENVLKNKMFDSRSRTELIFSLVFCKNGFFITWTETLKAYLKRKKEPAHFLAISY